MSVRFGMSLSRCYLGKSNFAFWLGICLRASPQLKVTNCDLKFVNSCSVGGKTKSVGNLAALRFTACNDLRDKKATNCAPFNNRPHPNLPLSPGEGADRAYSTDSALSTRISCLHHCNEAIKQITHLMRPRAGLWMALKTERRFIGQRDTLASAVKQ